MRVLTSRIGLLSLTSSSLLHWLTLMVPATIKARETPNRRHPQVTYTSLSLPEAHALLGLVSTGTYFRIILMDSLLADDRRCLSSVGIDGAASAETPESCSNVGHVLLTSVIFQLTDSSLNLENVDHIIYI